MQIEWNNFADKLAERVQSEGKVTLSVDEITALTQTMDRTIRGRTFWLAVQRGKTFARAFEDKGSKIEFEPNNVGEEVRTVTFRRS